MSQKFWKSVLDQSNPEWNIEHHSDEASISNRVIKFYALEVASGHIVGAAITPDELSACLNAVKEMAGDSAFVTQQLMSQFSGLMAKHLAGTLTGADVRDVEHDVVAQGLMALSRTKVFEIAGQQHKVEEGGNWIGLLYRMKNTQQAISRFFFIRKFDGDHPGVLMPSANLIQLASKVVAMDTMAGSQSSVSRMLKSGGGAIVHPSFR